MNLTAGMEEGARRVADERGRGTKGALTNDDIHDMLAAVKVVGEALAGAAAQEPSTYWYNRARRILWPLLNEYQQARKVLR